MVWDTSLKESFVDDLKNVELEIISKEVKKCIDNIGNIEELYDTMKYLFEDIPAKMTGHRRRFLEIPDSFDTVFKDLFDQLKDYLGIDEIDHDFNVSKQLEQYVRFFDFIESLQKFDKNKAPDVEIYWRELINKFDNVNNFLFHCPPNFRPRREKWAYHFNEFMEFSGHKKLGLKTYYAGGICEVLNSLRIKHTHRPAYKIVFDNKDLENNFHYGFIQIFSIYVLSCYSFLELLKYWERNKKFIDRLLAGEIQ